MEKPVKELVERFYHELWNKEEEQVAWEILHKNLSFRGSLGSEQKGPDGFLRYWRIIHEALGDFMCAIEDLVVSQNRAAIKVRFKGRHQSSLFGIEATGREIESNGAAFFKSEGNQITDIWILGDIDAVRRQLGESIETNFDS